MGFRRIAPQVFTNTDGYTVRVGSRTTMEHLEDVRKAVIEVEFGPGGVCIYTNRITGWFINGRELSMSNGEKELVIERISSAVRFDGGSVELSSH